MKDWDEITDKIVMAVANVETTTKEEEIVKHNVLMYLYKSLVSEKTFDENIKILNKKGGKNNV